MKQLLSYSLSVALLFSFFSVKAQVIFTVAGNGTEGYTGDGGPAVLASFNHPDVVKFDKQGNMYIADERNNAIRKVDNAGIITTIAGGNTVNDAAGRGGVAATAHLYKPADIVIDSKGNMYVAEIGNNIISKIATNGVITVYAGNGVSGYNGDSIAATSASIRNPLGLTFDNVGNLYFSANGDSRVRKVDTAGIITTVAGDGSVGNAGDGGPATAAQIGLTGYIAFGRYKDLYIPDYLRHVVRRVDSTGNISTVAGNGADGTAGDGGPATAANIGSPYAIFFDYKYSMYISDRYGNVVRMVDTFGVISSVCGTGVAGFNGDGDVPTKTQFNNDLNMSDSDAAGNYYIADPKNNRIRRIGNKTTAVRPVAGLQGQEVILSPNPASTLLHIAAAGQLGRVLILDITGHIVADTRADRSTETNVNVSYLPGGRYFVKVNDTYAGSFVKD